MVCLTRYLSFLRCCKRASTQFLEHKGCSPAIQPCPYTPCRLALGLVSARSATAQSHMHRDRMIGNFLVKGAYIMYTPCMCINCVLCLHHVHTVHMYTLCTCILYMLCIHHIHIVCMYSPCTCTYRVHTVHGVCTCTCTYLVHIVYVYMLCIHRVHTVHVHTPCTYTLFVYVYKLCTCTHLSGLGQLLAPHTHSDNLGQSPAHTAHTCTQTYGILQDVHPAQLKFQCFRVIFV